MILQGYPGMRKLSRHLQASSSMFFEVFEQFDPKNLLLTQARREVLEDQLEVRRLRRTLVARNASKSDSRKWRPKRA